MSESLSPSWPPRRDVTPIFKQPPIVKVPKRLPTKSRSAAARDRRYAIERPIFLHDHPRCEAEWDGHCTRFSTEVHHRAGRAPEVFFDQALWLPTCRSCHHEIEHNRADAYERGFLIHRNGVEQ